MQIRKRKSENANQKPQMQIRKRKSETTNANQKTRTQIKIHECKSETMNANQKTRVQIKKRKCKSENTTTLTKLEEVGTLGRQESSLIGLVRSLNRKDTFYMFSK